MGLAEADYDRMACELAVRVGAPPTANDVCWSLANERGIQLGDPRSSGYEIEQVYRRQRWPDGRDHLPLGSWQPTWVQGVVATLPC